MTNTHDRRALAVLLRPTRLVRSVFLGAMQRQDDLPQLLPATEPVSAPLGPIDFELRSPALWFTAILETPGDPPTFEQLDLPRESAEAPKELRRRMPSGQWLTFSLEDTRAWPTVARYVLNSPHR
ncbi:hypothetical protein [Subtercola sp. YIM 133946]|uniref:hypothetical protein n=1 Tax=Subtercola sp. YIM 133946 TaxID=3118909 RepID=UPI002F9524E6